MADSDKGMGRESMMAHALAHTYGAEAVSLIVVYPDGDVQVAVQLHCDVTDADEQADIAQRTRQAIANLSRRLRERYLERDREHDVRLVRLVHDDDDDAKKGRH